jgi:hypothetical protein
LLAVLGAVGSSGGQTDNTLYALNFAGPDVGTKVANAQAACNSNAATPCFIVIGPTLAAFPAGTLPTPCGRCHFIDYRAGLPWNASATPNTLVYPTSAGDIAAPLNSAIAGCSATYGCKIEVAPFSLSPTLSAPVVINKNNVNIVCDSLTPMTTTYSSITTSIADAGGVFLFDAVSGGSVTGCGINATSLGASSGADVFDVFSSTNIQIKNNVIYAVCTMLICGTTNPTAGSLNGIRAWGYTNVYSQNVEVSGNTVTVPWIAFSTGDGAQGITYHDNYASNNFECFDFNGSGGVGSISSFSISSNIVTLNLSGGGAGNNPGWLLAVTGVSSPYAYLNGNFTILSNTNGLQFTFALTHANVSQTSITGQTQNYFPDAGGVRFMNNFCTNDYIGSYIEGMADVVVQGNQFFYEATSGSGGGSPAAVEVHATIPVNTGIHTSFIGNEFLGTQPNSFTGVTVNALHFFQNAYDWQVVGGIIRGMTGSGIVVDSTSGSSTIGTISGVNFVDEGRSASSGHQCGIELLQSSGNGASELNIIGNSFFDDGIPSVMFLYPLCQTAAGNAGFDIQFVNNQNFLGSGVNMPQGCSGCTLAAPPAFSPTTPTAGAGVCWKTTSTLGTCTAGTWPNCSTCN